MLPDIWLLAYDLVHFAAKIPLPTTIWDVMWSDQCQFAFFFCFLGVNLTDCNWVLIIALECQSDTRLYCVAGFRIKSWTLTFYCCCRYESLNLPLLQQHKHLWMVPGSTCPDSRATHSMILKAPRESFHHNPTSVSLLLKNYRACSLTQIPAVYPGREDSECEKRTVQKNISFSLVLSNQ